MIFMNQRISLQNQIKSETQQLIEQDALSSYMMKTVEYLLQDVLAEFKPFVIEAVLNSPINVISAMSAIHQKQDQTVPSKENTFYLFGRVAEEAFKGRKLYTIDGVNVFANSQEEAIEKLKYTHYNHNWDRG